MKKILGYLHIIHLLKSSTCFENYPVHLQEVYVVIVYMQTLVSSLSAGVCLVHRLRKNSFLTGAKDIHLQRVTIPESACKQLRRRPPEDEQSNAQNKNFVHQVGDQPGFDILCSSHKHECNLMVEILSFNISILWDVKPSLYGGSSFI
jgi:hypothetical protein